MERGLNTVCFLLVVLGVSVVWANPSVDDLPDLTEARCPRGAI